MPSVLTLSSETLAHIASMPGWVLYDGDAPDVTGEIATLYRAYIPKNPLGAYVVAYPGTGSAFTRRHSATLSELRWTMTLVVAGFSVDQVLNTVDLIRARLTGFHPVDDRASGRLVEADFGASLLPDTSVAGDVRYSLTLFYRMTTNRS